MGAKPPAEVEDLLDRRRAAREARDFALADRLRAEIETAGWRVVDGPSGSRLESLADRVESYPTVAAVPSLADQPDACERSVCMAVHGWPEDARRLVEACADGGTEVVAVDVGGLGLTPAGLLPTSRSGSAGNIHVVRVEEGIGHADAWNVAARRSRGRVLVFAEPSLEFGAAALRMLAEALDDGAVGLVGPFGLGTDDMRTFEAVEGDEVDALEYLLAMRRADLGRVGEFDAHYRFYRNLDLDFSYQVRAAGLAVRRVDCGEVLRHTHRLWESVASDERERLSRRNFNRFLDRWGR